MTDLQSRRARSLRVIQGFQRNSSEILEDAVHAALYRFLEDEKRWIRMDIEGAAFVTRNTEKPLYSFIILKINFYKLKPLTGNGMQLGYDFDIGVRKIIYNNHFIPCIV
ncbi:hypothetical protein EON65_15935 [archaeon]|nr:MAG: hypothetical protein EON65_15935 [archaeon]